MQFLTLKRLSFISVFVTACGVQAIFLSPLFAADDSLVLEVAAGDHSRENTLVTCELPPALRDGKYFTLTELDSSKTVPVQVDRTDGAGAAWIMREPLMAGKTRRYRLTTAAVAPQTAGGVTVGDDGKHLSITVGGKPVLRYNYVLMKSPHPKQECYARSGYLHPLYSPAGKVVTDDFNRDHPHQHGVMFAWRKSRFAGRGADCWDQLGGQGRVEHVKLESSGGGEVFGFCTARLRHVCLTSPAGPRTMLDETWTVRVVNLADRFLFDLTSVQNAVSDDPLTVEEYFYGGFAIRGPEAWVKARGRDYDFLTSEGKNKTNGDATRPRWVDFFGPLDGQTVGVTIMDHPRNFRYPQPVRLHPWLPYFCFAPAALGSFDIEKGKPYVSRYRFCVRDGEIEAAELERLWRDYADPPQVRIVSGS